MGSYRSRILVYTLVMALSISGTLVSGSVFAAGYDSDYLQDDEPTAGAMVADLLVARPLTLVATVVGAAGWVISLPFTLIGGNTGEAGERMVAEPFRYTFARPLGHMEEGTPPIRD
jgi:hypothetical protein